MKPRRVVVLLNAAAGAFVGQGEAAFRESLEASFAGHGIEAEVRVPPLAGFEAAARQAVEAARTGCCDAVVAGGGDGTIRSVAALLAGTRIPFGVLPLGTLNHFAADLGIPFDPAAAAAVIAEGHTETVDTATVNGRTFVNNSSIGLYPYMVLERERTRRRSALPKPLAMVWAALRVLRFFPLRRLSIPAAGRAPYRSPCVLVGNNEYDLTGPARGRRRQMQDGVLSLYIADQQSRLALVGFALRLLLGRIDPARDLKALTLGEFEIRSRRRRRLLVALDGEIETLRTPLRYATRPASLRVFVPRSPA